MKNIQAKLLKHRNIMLGIVALVTVFTLSPKVSLATGGNGSDDPFGIEPTTNLNISTEETDARAVVVNIINLALTFLGLIAVILILWGGFKWMTAGGNDESVEAAKKIIIAAVIGLAIILSAYAIANFFINSIQTAVEEA
ncbi:MAG TPA: pilin [Candidatus Magasanikbacteria bacterium]|nr:pilin [Candidatus Magasanikbacteria bacterium]